MHPASLPHPVSRHHSLVIRGVSGILSLNSLDSLLGSCIKTCNLFHHNPESVEVLCSHSRCKFDLVTTAPCHPSPPAPQHRRSLNYSLSPIDWTLSLLCAWSHPGDLLFLEIRDKVQATVPGIRGSGCLSSAALLWVPGPRFLDSLSSSRHSQVPGWAEW